MREIKFRAWDKEKKRMADKILNMSINDDGGYNVLVMHQEGFNVNITGATGRFELMQYTRLRDPRGKDVYEGDLIKVIHHDHVEGHGKVKTGENLHEVYFEEDLAGYYPFVDGSCSIDVDSDWDDWEVIGNIYENPELLK